MTPEAILIVAFIILVCILVFIAIQMVRGLKEAKARWELEAAENPFYFLADDEFVFIRYKDEVFPMTKLEKMERWDSWNRKEKREFYFTIKRNISKGRAKWVTTADGNKMYVESKKKREFLVERYNKISRNFERRFPQQTNNYKRDANVSKKRFLRKV